MTHLEENDGNNALWHKERSTIGDLLDDYTLKGICEQRLHEFSEAIIAYFGLTHNE